MTKRTFTKSLFKTSCECPAKLNYAKDPVYGSTKDDNDFLKALKEGGFQVGELARLNFPGGHRIDTLDEDEAIARTAELMKQENVTIFEAAVHYRDLFVRIDILNKRGKDLELIEVKSKSLDSTDKNLFVNKIKIRKGVVQLTSEWEPFILDIAFQSYVLGKAWPEYKISNHLMAVDKTKIATVDGINQRFFLSEKDGNQLHVITREGTTRADLGEGILAIFDVDREVQHVHNDYRFQDGRGWEERINFIAAAWVKCQRFSPVYSKDCGSCEFRIPQEMKDQGLKSGFEECWLQEKSLTEADLSRPFVFDLWKFNKSDELILNQRYFMDQIEQEDLTTKSASSTKKDAPPKKGLSQAERQWLQVEMVKAGKKKPYIDLKGLNEEFAQWKFPLHFIDFETSRVAIPFHKGRRPYEQIAFQFSHHVLESDGRVRHQTQWIHQDRGKFPNFDFARNLMLALEKDNGTILRFAHHENTVLNDILEQLKTVSSKEVPDRKTLSDWIRTVTKSPGKSEDQWIGERNMVDMCDLAKKYFYHPFTEGSNSIKDVLPAILRESHILQERYSKPIYGAINGIPSLNFKNHQWIQLDVQGNVLSPYKTLCPIFPDPNNLRKSIFKRERLADGGAALTAWARMQFTEMTSTEVDYITRALLNYCELDTFSMVLIYQYWRDALDQSKRDKSAA